MVRRPGRYSGDSGPRATVSSVVAGFTGLDAGSAVVETHLRLTYEKPDDFPPAFDDVRTPRALVEHLLREYTDQGDAVLDPFAGFGTTLGAAIDLDRVAYDVEYEPDRASHARERAPDARVEQGSVFDLPDYGFPPVDCVLTSPPYMVEQDDRNPFENYDGESDYGTYLDDVERAFDLVRGVLTADGTVLVDVANMKHDDEVTTLAWDVADVLSDRFHFDGEIVVTWEGDGRDDRAGTYGYGYDHSYVLVFGDRE